MELDAADSGELLKYESIRVHKGLESHTDGSVSQHYALFVRATGSTGCTDSMWIWLNTDFRSTAVCKNDRHTEKERSNNSKTAKPVILFPSCQ